MVKEVSSIVRGAPKRFMCEGCGRSFETEYVAEACARSSHGIGQAPYFATGESWQHIARRAGWSPPKVLLTSEHDEILGDRIDERVDALSPPVVPKEVLDLMERVAKLETAMLYGEGPARTYPS